VLSAAHAANILMPYSCRGGRCGSCRGRVLEGEVEYPAGMPDALSRADREAGYALFCSAHPLTDLTIELVQPEAIEPSPLDSA
jgi:CDP-4-dehydro-6-deoxyglucose reductase, E3